MDTLKLMFNNRDSDGELSFVYPLVPNSDLLVGTRNLLSAIGIDLDIVANNIFITDSSNLVVLGSWLSDAIGGYKLSALLEIVHIAKPDRRKWVPFLTKKILELSVLDLDSQCDLRLATKACEDIDKVFFETHLFQYRKETHERYADNARRLGELEKKYQQYMPFNRGFYPIIPKPGESMVRFYHVLFELKV